MENQEQIRRNAVRRRVLKGAHILFNDRSSVIDCVVRDLSERGARLKVESPIGIPDSFDLVLEPASDLAREPASVRNCRVTWRNATQIGVEFPKTMDSPPR